ncbi:hypothetical protein L218DRAFT_1001212 [Marasmius fiardii PR-910]|nr:hypothetical protein L218DRAFT_1001212 [Marasmius fiardii PR-910]
MEVEEPGHFSGFSKPYMRLFEEDENSFVYGHIRALPGRVEGEIMTRPVEVTVHGDDSRSPWDDTDAYRVYHVMRFFESLEGFFTRLADLTSTFIRLMDDLNAVGKTARSEEYEAEVWDGTVQTFVKFVMTDEEIWQSCRLKWKLPRLVDFGRLQFHIRELYTAIQEAKGKPKFQKLCIMDLPPELIDYIFNLANLRQVRLSASTCKAMKNIGASHLYHTRTVTLHFAKHERIMQMFDGDPGEEDFMKLAKEQSGALTRHVYFLVSRPDLTDAIQNLAIIDAWKPESRGFAALRLLMNEYYGPIYSSLNTLLTSCQGLTDLHINHFAITSGWLRTISQLPKLHSLDLSLSWIQTESVEDNIVHGRIPPSPQLLNLLFFAARTAEDESASRESIGLGLWCTLLLFPNIITLNHIPYRIVEPMWLPTSEVRERSNHFFHSLRKLTLGLTWDQIPILTGWITSSNARCTLTHLKLRSNRPLADHFMIPLLESLHSTRAPLEVLVFEGIKEGSLTLIERIAQLFPDLLGLTLI